MLVFGKDVDVQWRKRDRYQRIVGKVLVTDPTCQRQCPKTLDAGDIAIALARVAEAANFPVTVVAEWPQGGQAGEAPTNLGLAQVTAGLAWWYRKYAKEQSAEDAQRYEFAEQEARSHRTGLWSDGQPMPPWDWRKAAR